MSGLLTRRAFSKAAALVLTACMTTAALAQAQPSTTATASEAVTVLAAHPIVVSVAETLAEGTGIKVVRAAPANLPHTRWSAYFAGRGAVALARDAARAAAVLTLRSLWPEDPLYALARRANIRIVEIDAARPIDGALPGIALQAASSSAASPLAAQPWLNPSNHGRMADIVAADLQRLAPDGSDALGRNLAAFKQRLIALTAEAEAVLADAPNVSVIVLSDRLDYLMTALNLDVVPFEREDAGWDEAAIEKLATAVRDAEVAAVLHEALPDDAQRAVRSASPDVALLATEPVTTVVEAEQLLKRIVQSLTRAP